MKLLPICCLLVAGCTNMPGALQIHLAADKSQFMPHEPIQLQVTLSAVDAPICLGNSYYFHVDMWPVDRECEAAQSKDPWVCGTAFVSMLPVLIPIYPLGLAISVLDVADTLDRFEVIEKKEKKISNLSIIPLAGNSLAVLHGKDDTIPWQTDQKWEMGEYKIRARLVDGGMRLFPAPLFWKPYNHPVEAEVRIKVAAKSQCTADASGK